MTNQEINSPGGLGKAFDAGGADRGADLTAMEVSGIKVVAGGKNFPEATLEDASDALRATIHGGGSIRAMSVLNGVETAPPAGHEKYMSPEQIEQVIKYGTDKVAPGVTSQFG